MKRRWKKGYKAVTRKDGAFQSFSGSTRDHVKIKYKIDTVTERPEGYGPLCVFNNFLDAEHFLVLNQDLPRSVAIFECKYLKSEDEYIWFKPTEENPIYWSDAYRNYRGSVLADKVKLTKRINRKKMKRELRKKQ